MNPRPKAYESSALPLSYSGIPWKSSAQTVADAQEARQVLKARIKAATWKNLLLINESPRDRSHRVALGLLPMPEDVHIVFVPAGSGVMCRALGW